MKSTSLEKNVEYQTHPAWVKFQDHDSSLYTNIEEKVWLLVKKIQISKDWQG